MKKTLIILGPLLAVSLPVLLAVASRSAPDATLDRRGNTGVSVVGYGLLPRTVVDQQTYDFGTMDPLQTAAHSFVIRNEGPGPLKLTTGSTTCKCTVSEITQSVIEPGGCGEVRITWNTGRLKPIYAHGATILTNDPRQRSIDLRICGIVRVKYCFIKQRWDDGLPMLAHGSNARLAAVAKVELRSPETCEPQMDLADHWWELADSGGRYEEAMRSRAAYWYARALPRLEAGIQRVKAEVRMQQAVSTHPRPQETAQ